MADETSLPPPHRIDRYNTLVPLEREGDRLHAVIFTTKARRSSASDFSRVKPTKDELKKLYREKLAVEPFVKVQVLNSFAASSSIHSICLRRKARVVAGLGIKPVTKAPEGKYRRIVRLFEKGQKQQEDELTQLLARGPETLTPSGNGNKPKGSQIPPPGESQAPVITPFPTFAQMSARQILAKQQAADDFELNGIKEKDYRDAVRQLAVIEKEHQILQDWIDNAGGMLTLREVIERGWYDYENLGWAALEVLRNGEGDPVELVHAPSHLVRMTKDMERFVYMKAPTKYVWFKRYGEKRRLNSETGEWAEEGRTFPDDKDANEMLFWKQYSPLDPYYGVPGWYAALTEILAAGEARDFMLYFFTKRAMPTYIVTFEGPAWSNDSLAALDQFFKNDLPRDYHATLGLEVPAGGKITFNQITTEPKGAIVTQKYLDSVRDAIVSAHGLFPAIVGVIETAHLGAGTEGGQMNLLKTVEIRPSQETLENILNKNVVWAEHGLNLQTQMLKLDEIDLYDEQVEADIIGKLYTNAQLPTMSPNDARKRLRMEPDEEEGADDLLTRGPQGNFLPLHAAVEENGSAPALPPPAGAPPVSGNGRTEGAGAVSPIQSLPSASVSGVN